MTIDEKERPKVSDTTSLLPSLLTRFRTPFLRHVSEVGLFGRLKGWKGQETLRSNSFRVVVKTPYILFTQRMLLSLQHQRASGQTFSMVVARFFLRLAPSAALLWKLIITGMYSRPPDGHEQCDCTKAHSKACLLGSEQLPNLL